MVRPLGHLCAPSGMDFSQIRWLRYKLLAPSIYGQLEITFKGAKIKINNHRKERAIILPCKNWGIQLTMNFKR